MSTRTRIRAILMIVGICGGMTFGSAGGSAHGGAEHAEGNKPPGVQSVKEGAPSPIDQVKPELARLEMFIGPWRVTETHFSRRGEVVATAKGTEEITWILDRCAIRRVYQSDSGTNVYRAIGTLTFNDIEGKYQGVWFDNASRGGPTTVKGEWDEGTLTMVFTLESLATDGSVVRHKVVERFVDEKRRVATTYLLKGTEIIKRTEVQYQRAIPCPAGVRRIFDDALGQRGG